MFILPHSVEDVLDADVTIITPCYGHHQDRILVVKGRREVERVLAADQDLAVVNVPIYFDDRFIRRPLDKAVAATIASALPREICDRITHVR